jgi:hypothetical protein
MKTAATALFAVYIGAGLSTAAVAEPFNDRGQDVIANVQSEATNVGSTVADTSKGFNNRGVDYIADAPDGKPSQDPMISLRDKKEHGWNG